MSARVDKILARFQKTVQELQQVANQADNEIKLHDEDISRLQNRRNELSEEKLQALGVANKISGLIAA